MEIELEMIRMTAMGPSAELSPEARRVTWASAS